MAEVITRFKLETTQYDSKLRDAAKELSQFAKQAADAGNQFSKFTSGNVEAARAFGSIGTSATNAKDKVKELVGAYNDMAKAYNNLTVEQQKSDFGKAMAESMQQLKVRIREAKQEMQELANTKMPDVGGGGLFGGGKLDGMLQVFGGNLMTKAAGFAMGAIQEMGDLVKESIEVAKSAEGIRIAYDRLNKPGLMQQLKEETHGVVSELELMKAAVKFNDFNLPVEQLGTMLAFAQQKAKDTGQSVDYMVDSIVTGLGRKSLMILDNLGLSAAEIKEKMKETGDMTTAVGAIIREQMAKAGDYVETAADRASKANADLQDAMLRLGDTFRPLSDSASNMWTNIKVGALDLLNNAIRPLIDSLTEAGRLRRELANINATTGTEQTHSQKTLGMLKYYRGDKEDLYNRQRSRYAAEEERHWRNVNRLQRELNDLRKQEKANPTNGSYAGLITATNLELKEERASALAWKQTREEYETGAKEILNPTPKPKPKKDGDEDNKKKYGTTPRVTTRVTPVEEVAPEGSMKALQKEMQDLANAQQLVTDPESWQDYQRQIEGVKEKMDALKGVVKDVDDELAKLEAPIEINVEANVDTRTDLEKLQDKIRAEISDKNIEVDTKSLSTLMKVAIENGIENMDADFTSVLQNINMDIPDERWMELVDKINEQLKDLGIEPITLDVQTGNLKKDGKDAAMSWQEAAHSVQAVGSALQQLGDPGAKIIGTIAQAIANVALAFSEADVKEGSSGNIWSWIAATAAGLATMVSTIATIKSSTSGNFAEGGIVPGNSYSGDNIKAYGLNSGELILSASQQNNIAGLLQGNSLENLNLSATVSAEQIRFVLNNRGRRTGRGEYVQAKFR